MRITAMATRALQAIERAGTSLAVPLQENFEVRKAAARG